jgi:RNA polymerase sigma factor (TIGR02999 family)
MRRAGCGKLTGAADFMKISCQSDRTQRVTQILASAAEPVEEPTGDPTGAAPPRPITEELLPLLYDELRELAAGYLAHDSQTTLQPTALVHEAYLRLLGGQVEWRGRGHFFSAAALAMRRILVERARHRRRLKRGGGRPRVPLDDAAVAAEADGLDLLALDEALERLSAEDERKGRVVSLRYFAGLSLAETAQVLGISEATAKRDWDYACAWLYDALGDERNADDAGEQPGCSA